MSNSSVSATTIGTEPINVDEETVTAGDAAWILSNAFLILTMQSGFGLLEAGYVSIKNVTNIMVKNVVDVCLGGITYWAFGYGLSFGEPSGWFCGWGSWFATAGVKASEGSFYTHYVFQFSFATAATTIVSGAIAERMKFNTYMLFSVLNTFVYVFPVAWAWNPAGFLAKMGFHDFAGACVVHMGGGASALVAAFMLGPRIGRFEPGGSDRYPMSSAVTGLTGTFMLWWAWLAFNCGSTFAIEGNSWKVASKVGVNTLNGSIGGGIAGIIFSIVKTRGRVYDVNDIIAGVLGGLVGITAGCAVFTPAVSLFVGLCGALTAFGAAPLLEKLHIDDPVGAVPVHLFAAITSTLAVGLFGVSDYGEFLDGRGGLLYTGNPDQLAVQAFGIFCIAAWSMTLTFVLFVMFKYTVGYRVSAEEEEKGADAIEHNIKHVSVSSQIEQALQRAFAERNLSDGNIDQFVNKFVEKLLVPDCKPENLPTSHNLSKNIIYDQEDLTGFRHLRIDSVVPAGRLEVKQAWQRAADNVQKRQGGLGFRHLRT